MKNLILVLFLFTLSFNVKAQSDAVATENSVYEFVEVAPSFPGGMERFNIYLSNNIKYPAKAWENNVQGRVYIQFVIEKNGDVSDAKILRPISKELDEEALRVVSNSPRWSPGIQNGKAVRVKFTVPITFTKPVLNAASDTSFVAVDSPPMFPGGLQKLINFLEKNIKRKGNKGEVKVTFVVEKDGSLTNIAIGNSLSPSADAEVIRVMNISPKWIPASQAGRPVRVRYSIPIGF